MKNQYDEKIEYLDKIIENEIEFEKYIENIESLNICIPENLNSEIYKKLNISKVIQFKKDRSILDKTIDIFKIVACMIFALLVWNTTLSKPINIDTRIIKDEKIIDNLDMKMRNINNRLNNIDEEERNDK